MTARTRIRYKKYDGSYVSNPVMSNLLIPIYILLTKKQTYIEARILHRLSTIEVILYPNLTIAKRKIRKRLMTEYGVNLYEEIRG